MFSVDEFQKLKSHVPAGSTSIGFYLRPGLSISITLLTLSPPLWEMRIHDEATCAMCILTEKAGVLAADHRRLVPRPNDHGYDFQPLVDLEFEQRAQALFAETVAFLEGRRAEELEADRRATDKLHGFAGDEAAMQRWRWLVAALVPDESGAERIARATSRAFAAPETFLRRLRLPRVTDDVPWLALIQALKKEKLLAELDWRADPEDVALAVDRLCAQSGRPALDWTAVDEGQPAAGWLNAANRRLEAAGAVLACLDAGGDRFATVLVAADQFEAASSHAAAFRWRLTTTFA